jgi:restriction endonuclease Mrr
VNIPDYQSLMLPVVVASSKGEVRVGAVVEELADQLGLSLEERSELLPSGKQTVSNRVHWAKTYLAQAALIENTRSGYFKITARGQQTLAAQRHILITLSLASSRNFSSSRSVRGRRRWPTRQTLSDLTAFTYRPNDTLQGTMSAPAHSAIFSKAWTATKLPKGCSSRLRRSPPLQRKPQGS